MSYNKIVRQRVVEPGEFRTLIQTSSTVSTQDDLGGSSKKIIMKNNALVKIMSVRCLKKFRVGLFYSWTEDFLLQTCYEVWMHKHDVPKSMEVIEYNGKILFLLENPIDYGDKFVHFYAASSGEGIALSDILQENNYDKNVGDENSHELKNNEKSFHDIKNHTAQINMDDPD
jgi:hypothetical protein